jgi:hypothetical protein
MFTDTNGKYMFDATKLSEYHHATLQLVVTHMKQHDDMGLIQTSDKN